MCGIAAYVGENKCRNFVVEGLSRLEYRGYDSAGFVCIDAKNGHLNVVKAKGRLSELKDKLSLNQHDGFVGMGHTRWATHGIANETNTHPHFDCKNKIAVIHNGIIENYGSLRDELLAKGHIFKSTTDTETVAHLFEDILQQHTNLHAAIVDLASKLKGAYAFVFILEDYPNQLLVMRHKSPVAIGIGDNEMFVGSDSLVFSDKTEKTLFMPDESFALVSKDSVKLYHFSGKQLDLNIQNVQNHYSQNEKNGYEHFMLKEIYEQKPAINKTVHFYKKVSGWEDEDIIDSKFSATITEDQFWNQVGISKDEIKNLKQINLLGAGTSWHSAKIAQFFFEYICKIPTKVYLASEFRYMPFFPQKDSAFIMISQSGETADTLEALRFVSTSNIPTIALTNVASSTMVREANGFLLLHAGPEISVCSTKAFSCQLASLYWFANRIAFEKGLININQMHEAEEDLLFAAEILETSIEMYKNEIENKLAKIYSMYDKFIFLGRHISYPFAMEAALKLKEISYIFAQAYPSGELKHGPIALIDENVPVVIFSSLDETIYRKIVSNAQEVKARMGHLIVFAFENQKELLQLADLAFVIPPVKPLLAPLAMTGLMQFFVYQITKELGLPIDKPRNLAKSVTVE
ncbi:TPA: glutamine--fructose-6-phosphate transaminase (isomerizing) [Candidatus Dependentiae bacterium]|nr:MAG: Isomerizing Glutamine-fructose-6-phosphate aminotransferase [candidate division TM6 bacterium GW2011_GWE2_31_21]KKP54107.1 MAG: Isomerizing Glutamine-fructose-6-phosphate aminotransferase [candidate division TM6 bacterium GW2011_GWF2_33_332]HBS48311.1 glutamine--fructose-6-phosphate transaminase (isomerizing) [Candidatus Dependentiae bacterium]HBZ73015.1 glutamine--fructose-6-phosphate transaminase (isomerizing) [Candidatus Dependentiae bacterium]